MATESPLLHDGSQFTANSNYGNSTSGLGNGGSAQFQFVAITASRVLSLATSTGQACYGVLQNKPAAAAACDVGIWGISKVVAGAAITAGAKLMTNSSGAAITWTSGSGYFQLGQAIETVTSSGQVFTAFINGPINPSVLT
jgi:hypothetical protein